MYLVKQISIFFESSTKINLRAGTRLSKKQILGFFWPTLGFQIKFGLYIFVFGLGSSDVVLKTGLGLKTDLKTIFLRSWS